LLTNIQGAAMQKIDLILKEGEGQFVEFKRGLSDIASELVAFANASGGRIYIGIDDHGVVPGINVDNALKSRIEDIARNCDPSIRITLNVHSHSGKEILEIDVLEGADKPYQCKDGFYLRQGANSQKLKRNEITSLIITTHGRTFDSQINNDFDFKRDFDSEKFKKYLELAGLDVKIKKETLLTSLEVMKNNKITNAGALFFSKEPQRFLRNSVFTCALFRGKERTDVIDRKEINGGLFEIVEDVMKFVEKNTRVAELFFNFVSKPRRSCVFPALRLTLS